MEDIILLVLKKYITEAQLKWTEDAIRNEAKKYNTAKEFRNANFSAYNSALKKGKDFFNDVTSHMTRLKRGKYSDDELRDIAKKYQTKNEFLKASPGGYDAALSRGKDFYDEITSHMIDGHTKPRKYDDTTLKTLISKYDSLTDFRNENPGAYHVILRKPEEVRNELYKNLKIKRKPYSKEEIINISKKYEVLKDFWDNESSAVVAAKKYSEDFFNEVTKHMIRLKRNKYSDDELIDIAKKYDTFVDFVKKEPSVYSILLKRNLAKQATEHMKRSQIHWSKDDLINLSKQYGNLRDFRKDYENLYAWALNNVSEKERKEIFSHFEPLGNIRQRLIYAIEFPDKSVYVGLTFDADGRYKQHQKSIKSAVNKYTKETGLKPEFKKLTDYVTDKEAVKLEDDYVNEYKKNGWNILNIAKPGALGSIPIKWTIDAIKDEAAKYNSRAEFSKNSPKAYGAAIRYNIIDMVTQHMGKRKNEFIPDDYLIQTALKYKTLKDFRNEHDNLYQLIVIRGLLDKATKHMSKKRKIYTNDELTDIAHKYKSKIDFYNNDLLAYVQASRRGILNDITKHYTKTRESWTVDKIKDEASKYDTVSQFKKTPAYQAAHRMGILQDITKHMKRGKMFGQNNNK